MNERIVGNAEAEIKVYPPGVKPEPYVPPWLWERQKPGEE